MLKSFSGSKSFGKNSNATRPDISDPVTTSSDSNTKQSSTNVNASRQQKPGARPPHPTRGSHPPRTAQGTQGDRVPQKLKDSKSNYAPQKVQDSQSIRTPHKSQNSRGSHPPQTIQDTKINRPTQTTPDSQINRTHQAPQGTQSVHVSRQIQSARPAGVKQVNEGKTSPAAGNFNNSNVINRPGVVTPDNTVNKANLNNPNNKAHQAASLIKNIIKDGISQSIKPRHSDIKPDHKSNKTKDPRSSVPTLKVIPLGGMREIGKNMFVYEYGDDIIIVDCGIGFPEENMPGIDVVIPDMSYVFQNKAKVRGIFFTHGHEDHIGAVAWLTNEVRAPIYGSKLTVSLIALKLEDRGGAIKNVDLRPVEDGDIIKSGCFTVEFIHANHSIADANMLAIKTPVGCVIHTGDFKIDYTPINGDPIDLSRIASLGHEKPLLMLCESTNIEKSGFSMSESKVGESFINIFDKAPGRVIVATFSSNIYRMQQIFTAAEYYNRKVCLIGRSIINVFNAANSLGYMKIKPETLVDINKVKNIPPENLVIISTGSQGETLSALTRMAFNEHQKIEISSGDTIIISASPIPGNEKPIYRVINELYLRGANVIYSSLAEVHASGHAYQEELKLIHQLVKPKYFVPVHGEYRMLFQHSALAHNMGLPQDNSFLLSNGDILELTANSAKVTGYVPADGILIDGYGFGDIGNTVLSDRKLLSDDGVLSVAIAVSGQTGTLLGEPHIETRGFIYEAEEEEITKEIKNKVFVFVNKCSAANKPLMPLLKSTALRDQLRDFLFDRTKRRPIIIISAIEV